MSYRLWHCCMWMCNKWARKKWKIWLYFYLPPPSLAGWRNCEGTVEINLCGWMLSGLRHSRALSPLKVVTVPLNVSLTLITGSIVSLERRAKYNSLSARGFPPTRLIVQLQLRCTLKALTFIWIESEMFKLCDDYMTWFLKKLHFVAENWKYEQIYVHTFYMLLKYVSFYIVARSWALVKLLNKAVQVL